MGILWRRRRGDRYTDRSGVYDSSGYGACRDAGREGVDIGAATGLDLCAGTLRTMQSVLYGVSVYDMPTIFAVVGVLALVTLIASLVPTLRIAGIDPAKTLREE